MAPVSGQAVASRELPFLSPECCLELSLAADRWAPGYWQLARALLCHLLGHSTLKNIRQYGNSDMAHLNLVF